jgi:hypothetical protein
MSWEELFRSGEVQAVLQDQQMHEKEDSSKGLGEFVHPRDDRHESTALCCDVVSMEYPNRPCLSH